MRRIASHLIHLEGQRVDHLRQASSSATRLVIFQSFIVNGFIVTEYADSHIACIGRAVPTGPTATLSQEVPAGRIKILLTHLLKAFDVFFFPSGISTDNLGYLDKDIGGQLEQFSGNHIVHGRGPSI